jgi:diamine N-acetyltransferase
MEIMAQVIMNEDCDNSPKNIFLMEIRRATIDDAGTLSKLNGEVQRMHSDALPDLFKFPEKHDFALPFMREQLANPKNYVYIAQFEGQDIGYIFARLVDHPENAFMFAWQALHIEHISINPSYRSKGFGSQLMDTVKELASQSGIHTIVLDTWSFNHEAQSFFSRQGFVPFLYHMWYQDSRQ